jgi:hypothetical protein
MDSEAKSSLKGIVFYHLFFPTIAASLMTWMVAPDKAAYWGTWLFVWIVSFLSYLAATIILMTFLVQYKLPKTHRATLLEKIKQESTTVILTPGGVMLRRWLARDKNGILRDMINEVVCSECGTIPASRTLYLLDGKLYCYQHIMPQIGTRKSTTGFVDTSGFQK